jgi:hypothetical protein
MSAGSVEEDNHMADEKNPNPATTEESDISKAQSQQQPSQQGQQQPEASQGQGQFEQGQPGQFETGQAGAARPEGALGETATEQRTDIEGASLQSEEKGEAESGFVGSQAEQDTSSELVQDEDEDEDFAKGGQGAPEGK